VVTGLVCAMAAGAMASEVSRAKRTRMKKAPKKTKADGRALGVGSGMQGDAGWGATCLQGWATGAAEAARYLQNDSC